MLSRLAFRAGISAWKAQAQGRLLAPAVNHYCTAVQKTDVEQKGLKKLTTEEYVAAWDAANATYYGPQRDLKNFPHPVQPETNPPTRMLFIPESWFNALYSKTGVTGPYLLLVGGFMYIMSKEILVYTHNFTETWFSIIMASLLYKAVGPMIRDMVDDNIKVDEEKTWYGPLREARTFYTDAIKDAEKNIWRAQGQSIAFDTMREMVDLQLEANFRARQVEAQVAIKKRLDYQLDKENTVKRFQQQHMAQWIEDNVVKGITPQQEKDSITKCISDLKVLAARQ